MDISASNKWKAILFLLPLTDNGEESDLRNYSMLLKENNPNLVIDSVYWNTDKKKTKSKEYVRRANEWNHTDFSLFGKMRNPHISQFFENKYDVFIICGEEWPKKVRKVILKSQSRLKIGFSEDFEMFDVIFRKQSANLQGKLNMLQKYLTNK